MTRKTPTNGTHRALIGWSFFSRSRKQLRGLAQERGLDLVLVDPPRNNQPAVCEIIRPDSGAPESTDVPDTDTSEPPDDAARQDEDWDLNDIDQVL